MGLTVNSLITVVDAFNDNRSNIINRENIIFKTSNDHFIDGETQGDLNLTEDLIVHSGETLTVNGKLIVNEGTEISIAQGGKLVVRGNITSNSATYVVAEGAVLQINDYFCSDSDTLDIAGDLVINADASFKSSVITANGIIKFKGDLSTSSCTWNSPNIAFISKLPQSISGSAISVNNLNIDNSSATMVMRVIVEG